MADRIAVIQDGLLQQVASPAEMYRSPSNATVAAVGSPAMNLGKWRIVGNVATFGEAKVELTPSILKKITPADNNQIIVGFRPESLAWTQTPHGTTIPLKVTFVEHLGSDAFVYSTVAGAEEESEKFGSGDNSAR